MNKPAGDEFKKYFIHIKYSKKNIYLKNKKFLILYVYICITQVACIFNNMIFENCGGEGGMARTGQEAEENLN